MTFVITQGLVDDLNKFKFKQGLIFLYDLMITYYAIIMHLLIFIKINLSRLTPTSFLLI